MSSKKVYKLKEISTNVSATPGEIIWAFPEKKLLVVSYKVDMTAGGKPLVILEVYPEEQYKIDKDGNVSVNGEPIQVKLIGNIAVKTFNNAVKPVIDSGSVTEIVPVCLKSRNDRTYSNIIGPREYQQKKKAGQIAPMEECNKNIERLKNQNVEEEAEKMDNVVLSEIEKKIINALKDSGGEMTIAEWKEFKNKSNTPQLYSEAINDLRKKGIVEVKSDKIVLKVKEEEKEPEV